MVSKRVGGRDRVRGTPVDLAALIPVSVSDLCQR